MLKKIVRFCIVCGSGPLWLGYDCPEHGCGGQGQDVLQDSDPAELAAELERRVKALDPSVHVPGMANGLMGEFLSACIQNGIISVTGYRWGDWPQTPQPLKVEEKPKPRKKWFRFWG